MHALLMFAAGALSASVIFAGQFELRVSSAAKVPLAVVTTSIPKEFPSAGVLKNKQTEIPFQKLAPDQIVFVLKDLAAREERTFDVEAKESVNGAEAKLKIGTIELIVDGKSVLKYQGAESEVPRQNIKPIFKRGGYIHPVLSPSGKLLTDDYPPNHVHHHGIWFPWTKTVFEGREPDFWNMGEGKGRVEFAKMGGHWSGPVCAGFTAKHRFIDLTSGTPKTALNETWSVQTYAVPGADYFVFDLTSVQTCATDAPLLLPKYYYGGLGFRGNWAWNGEANCFFLTSNGESDRVKGNETRGNWCHVGGEVAGALTGIAIFCHPENFRSPQPMRLHPKEPFFCFAPSQIGDWAIEPGKPYVSRYRFFIKDGRPNKTELDDVWEAYAHPPTVTVSRK
jgi:hypothetical protein